MTDIREGVAVRVLELTNMWSLCLADDILKYLQSQGVVMIDEGELPFARVDIEGKPEVRRFYDGYRACMNDYKEAGYKRTKSLV